MMIGLILLIAILYYLFSPSGSRESCCLGHHSLTNNPLEILNERYARSEIQREEYLEKKHELTAQSQHISIKKGK